jgi:hypothetical protein
VGHLGHQAMAGGRRLALGCTTIASYYAGWLPKAVAGVAHVKIRVGSQFVGQLEAP